MTTPTLLVAFFVCAGLVSPGVVANQLPKATNYELDITFEPEQRRLSGMARVTFAEPLSVGDTIRFYLHGEISVDSIKQSGVIVEASTRKVFYHYSYSMIANQIEFVHAGTDDSLAMDVFYSGLFNRSAARSPSDYMRIDSDGVLLRSYGYSLWFPIFLQDRSSSQRVDFSRVSLRVPSDYRCVFVGTKETERLVNGHAVSIWSAYGIDIMAVQCTAQRWEVLSEGWLSVYHLPDSASRDRAAAIRDFAESFHNRCDERLIRGRLPQQAFIMEMPEFGDISSANVTGISSSLWREFGHNPYSMFTLAHEIAHSYVHVPIDHSDPLAAFVIEGFPSYFDDLVLADILGEAWLRSKLDALEESYLSKRTTGLDRYGRKLPPEKCLDQIGFDEIGTYKDRFILTDRTSLLFNYLRVKMGADTYAAFERALFDYDRLSDQRFRNLVLTYLPGADNDLHIWLSTTEYPERFKLSNLR